MNNFLYSYTIDEVDTIAKELIAQLQDTGVGMPLAVLGLCRALVMCSTTDELDGVCATIDRLAELPFDEVTN